MPQIQALPLPLPPQVPIPEMYRSLKPTALEITCGLCNRQLRVGMTPGAYETAEREHATRQRLAQQRAQQQQAQQQRQQQQQQPQLPPIAPLNTALHLLPPGLEAATPAQLALAQWQQQRRPAAAPSALQQAALAHAQAQQLRVEVEASQCQLAAAPGGPIDDPFMRILESIDFGPDPSQSPLPPPADHSEHSRGSPSMAACAVGRGASSSGGAAVATGKPAAAKPAARKRAPAAKAAAGGAGPKAGASPKAVAKRKASPAGPPSKKAMPAVAPGAAGKARQPQQQRKSKKAAVTAPTVQAEAGAAEAVPTAAALPAPKGRQPTSYER